MRAFGQSFYDSHLIEHESDTVAVNGLCRVAIYYERKAPERRTCYVMNLDGRPDKRQNEHIVGSGVQHIGIATSTTWPVHNCPTRRPDDGEGLGFNELSLAVWSRAIAPPAPIQRRCVRRRVILRRRFCAIAAIIGNARRVRDFRHIARDAINHFYSKDGRTRYSDIKVSDGQRTSRAC